jgi:SAM-dependent methyltransferase
MIEILRLAGSPEEERRRIRMTAFLGLEFSDGRYEGSPLGRVGFAYPLARMSGSRQAFAEERFGHAWSPSRFDVTRGSRLRELLEGRPPGLLLDVGCYDGQFISRVVDGGAIIGMDVSHTALRAASARGVMGVRAQIEAAVPFASESFATVVAAEVIEHVFDTQAVLNELGRVLRPGGWLALTTPNLVALSGRAQLLLGRSPHNVEFDASSGTSGHIRYFTFDTLELLVRRAGLTPCGRWTNVAHFSVFGSSQLVGRLRPGLGHTLISLAVKPSAVSHQLSAHGGHRYQ